ncbi:hypothetical protein ENSA5_39080 [Enhygromyxa salina]|uniref:Uncharacterized protein n=1 Tax=Enhygromyxa salina TaxID=215803 RepID=A0A2S9XRF2_9BACT|nr:hypothetical protein ENSA5_39080 [Enhygromyxa salina]
MAAFGLAALACVAFSSVAEASPGVDGTRNLSMGNATRGSSTGTDAAIINPAGLSYSQQFEIEPIYQFNLQTRTHGLGVFISDSLNSPRLALALGYVFMRGTPQIRYDDITGERESLELVNFGHEVSGVLSVTAIKNWLFIGVKPKWQYVSLRYLDTEGVALDYMPKHNAFGLDASIALNFVDWAKIAVVGYNIVGPNPPARTDDPVSEITGLEVDDDPRFNDENVSRVSDYQRSLGHGLAVFPLRNPNFSLNIDATYDFTSYWDTQNKWTRVTVNAGGEFVAGPVPIRLGGWWDSRGRGSEDDRGYVSAGLGFIRPAKLGGVGVDVGLGFAQQVTGAERSKLDTILSLNIGLRLRPDL